MRHVPSPPSAASMRLALVRFPWLRRSLQALAACVVGFGIWSNISATEDERRSWGQTVEVLVAERDLTAGTPLAGDDVSVESWPTALVPDGALTSLDDGGQVRQDVSRGEVLVDQDLAGGGPVGLVADGQRAVSVPVEPDVLAALRIGDRVGVVVAGEEAADGTVVAVGGVSVTVAVPRSAAPRIADATLLGTATVVLGG